MKATFTFKLKLLLCFLKFENIYKFKLILYFSRFKYINFIVVLNGYFLTYYYRRVYNTKLKLKTIEMSTTLQTKKNKLKNNLVVK